MSGEFFIHTARVVLLAVLAASAACAPPGVTAPKANPEGAQRSGLARVGDVPGGSLRYHLYFTDERRGWLANDRALWRTADGGATWEPSYTIPEDAGEILSVQFAGPQTGWMLSLSKLYRTDDGGSTWSEQHVLPPGSAGEIRAVSFAAGGKTGWAAGGVYRPGTREEIEGASTQQLSHDPKKLLFKAVFRTDDGGKTWREQALDRSAGRLARLFFIDADHGWALSGGDGDTGIFRTADGGAHWDYAEYRNRCGEDKGQEDFEGRMVAVSFLDAATGWLSFNNGSVAKSNDGGLNWCEVTPAGSIWPKGFVGQGYLQEFHFSDTARGWGLGGDGSLHVTTDGGATWKPVETGAGLDDIHFINATQGFAVSEKGLFRLAF